MKCPRCQQDNPPQAKFCLECASSLDPRCTNCGTQLPAGARFCFECGTPVSAPVSLPRFASPQTYTPKHLAERIINSKAALEGERKQVTVLFADLKGSMELLADRDPEEARKLLDPVIEHMMEAVHHYEGTVNQVMGDGIMALFGAPVAHEDHAVRACYAALRMQNAVRHYSDELRRVRGVEVQIRVGLNSGDVVVRTISSDLRMDYTAVGQTTHLAARMEQLAPPASIRLTAQTLQLAESFVQVTPLGPVPIKGLGEPVEVFELIGAGVARTRLDAAARRGLTRFIGRNAELEQLWDALDRVSRGHGQVVAVVGEPGVGKSRLFWEFTRSDRVHGWLILQSASVSYGRATAYLPAIELLRGYFEIESRDGPGRIREKVTGKILTHAPALGPAVPALLALLDVPVEEASWEGLDPRRRRQQMLVAVKRLLLHESEVQPLVVVFEDLHWIDSETQTLLDSLVDALPATRLLLLVNYRPEYQHAWGDKTYYRQLRIDPLPREGADRLLDALLGTDVALGPLKQLLVERTEANPFFLEESVRALVETGALGGERGAYRLTRSVEHLTIPATVRAVLAARIDRLAPDAKRLLQAAAVVGKDVPLPLLLAIADASEHEVRAELTHLQAAEFLYEIRLFPDLEYTFIHALTYEVAYLSLLSEQRRGLHAGVMKAIERLYPDRLVEHVDRLAHHAVAAEAWEQGLGYLRQAGAKALSRSAHRTAVGHFRKALEVLAKRPESRERTTLAIDIRFDLRNALLPLGELEQILDYLREAEALATTLGDSQRDGQLAVYMTGHFYLIGEHARALEFGQRSIAIAEAVKDFGLRVATNAYVGQIYYVLGDYGLAADFFSRNVEALVGAAVRERFGLPQLPSVHSRTCLVWALAERGHFAEALSISKDAVAVAESIGDPLNIVVAYSGLGVLRSRQGEWTAAIETLERAMHLIRDSHIALWLPRVASTLGATYAAVGRLEEGMALLQEAVDQAAAMHLVSGRSMLMTAYGDACLRARRFSEADELSVCALKLARDHGERGHMAWVLKLRGEVELGRRPASIEEATGFFREALELSEELGMRPLAAQTRIALAKVEARLGRQAAASEYLQTAIAGFRDMNMAWWVARAEAEAAGLR